MAYDESLLCLLVRTNVTILHSEHSTLKMLARPIFFSSTICDSDNDFLHPQHHNSEAKVSISTMRLELLSNSSKFF